MTFTHRIAGLAAALLPALLVAATATARPQLNDTGARRCVDAEGHFTLSCAGTGQDGEFGRDVTAPASGDGLLGFRFIKVCSSGERAGQGSCPVDPPLGAGANEWGCTHDRITGRLWEMKVDSGFRSGVLRFSNGAPNPPDPDVSALIAEVNAAALCGAADWVLPNHAELQSIVHYDIAAPVVDGAFFPNTANSYYWSASPFFGVHALAIAFGSGAEDAVLRDRSAAARLVHSPGLPTSARYAVPGGAAPVLDRWTGLTWQRCADGQAWDGSTCAGTPTPRSWADALALAGALGSGWRLPNVKELNSLLATGLMADATAFPGTPECIFWSSTPTRDTANAWGVYFGRGFVAAEPRTELRCVRLVRGA